MDDVRKKAIEAAADHVYRQIGHCFHYQDVAQRLCSEVTPEAIAAYETALWSPIDMLPTEGHVILADDDGNSLPVFIQHYTHCDGDPDWTRFRMMPEPPKQGDE